MVHPLKIFLVAMVQKATFNNVFGFMAKREKSVLTQIVVRVLSVQLFQIEQHFIARGAKNNKVDANYCSIYTVLKNA